MLANGNKNYYYLQIESHYVITLFQYSQYSIVLRYMPSNFHAISRSHTVGTAFTGAVILHVIILSIAWYLIKTTNFFDSHTSAVQHSAISLNFSKVTHRSSMPTESVKPVIQPMPVPVKESLQQPEVKKISVAKPAFKATPPVQQKQEQQIVALVKEQATDQQAAVTTSIVKADLADQENVTTIQQATFKGKRHSPRYHPRAVRMGMEGTVVVKALIDEHGAIKDVQLLESSGYRLLDREVLKVAWKWNFTPAYSNGKPKEQWVKAPYQFVINQRHG